MSCNILIYKKIREDVSAILVKELKIKGVPSRSFLFDTEDFIGMGQDFYRNIIPLASHIVISEDCFNHEISDCYHLIQQSSGAIPNGVEKLRRLGSERNAASSALSSMSLPNTSSSTYSLGGRRVQRSAESSSGNVDSGRRKVVLLDSAPPMKKRRKR